MRSIFHHAKHFSPQLGRVVFHGSAKCEKRPAGRGEKWLLRAMVNNKTCRFMVKNEPTCADSWILTFSPQLARVVFHGNAKCEKRGHL